MFRDRRCSEPKCGGPLTPTTKVCPRCGGDVVGTIANPKHRLAAEEAHQKAAQGSALTIADAELPLPAAPAGEPADRPTSPPGAAPAPPAT